MVAGRGVQPLEAGLQRSKLTADVVVARPQAVGGGRRGAAGGSRRRALDTGPQPHPVLELLAILPPETIGEIANTPRIPADRIGRLGMDALEVDGRRAGRGGLRQGSLRPSVRGPA